VTYTYIEKIGGQGFFVMTSTKKAEGGVISPEQSRAARAWLGWSQSELADRANLSLSTVRDFETHQRTPIPNNIAAMQHALEEAGIRWMFDQEGVGNGIMFHFVGHGITDDET
jgi:DNA-binding transcriptional regulator YiaG